MSNSISHRYDFVYLFDVDNGNPNGDPDGGNMPRMDMETGHGLVTDVCLKRKIRNYIAERCADEPGYAIYVADRAVLNEQHRQAYRAVRPDADNDKVRLRGDNGQEERELTRWMCDHFFDVRTFGAVMNTKINCGQVRGPVQLALARSLEPIHPQELVITRMASTDDKELQARQAEGPGESVNQGFGRRAIVPYGLYRVHGFVSANLAARTGFSAQDLELLWESLHMMWDHDRSAARGEMSARGLYVFEHESKMGNARASALFERVLVTRLDPETGPARAFSDYAVQAETQGLPRGVTLSHKCSL